MQNNKRPLRIVLVGGEGKAGELFATLKRYIPPHYVVFHTHHAADVFTLGSDAEYDCILLLCHRLQFSELAALETLRESGGTIPVVLLAAIVDEVMRERAMRLGAAAVIPVQELHRTTLRQVLAPWQPVAMALRHRQRSLEQALQLLQHRAALPVARPESGVFRPLSEVMPLKFLELAKSYSNVLQVALAASTFKGYPMGAHSVSRKLQVLAADLGLLNAGASDVMDLHEQAIRHVRFATADPESKRVLLELMTGLISYYRELQQANA